MPMPVDTAVALLNHLNGLTPLTIVGPARLVLRSSSGPIGATEPGQPANFSVAAYDLSTNYEIYALNTTNILFTNMPNVTVVGWEVRDSSTPFKVLWAGETLRDRLVTAGDSYEILPGQLRVNLFPDAVEV